MAEQRKETKKPKLPIPAKKEYFARLAKWARKSNSWQMHTGWFLHNAVVNQNRLMKQEAQKIAENNAKELRHLQNELYLVRVLDGNERLKIIHDWGGIEMLVSPFWKRGVAELIDTLNIFILKTMVFFFIAKMYASINVPDSTVQKPMGKEKIFEFSLDLINPKYKSLIQLLLTKLFICTFEFLWIYFNKGSTPGKYLMNIRVLHVDYLVPLRQQQLGRFQLENTTFWALIYPGITPDALKIFMRLVAKHLVITCFFPVCFLLVYAKTKRTSYDVVSQTLVVEMNSERFPVEPRLE